MKTLREKLFAILDEYQRDAKRSGKLKGTCCWLAFFQAAQMFVIGTVFALQGWEDPDADLAYLSAGWIDAFLLINAALGVCAGIWQFALALVIYQTLNVLRFAVVTVVVIFEPDRFMAHPALWFIVTLIAVVSLWWFWITYLSLKPSRKNV